MTELKSLLFTGLVNARAPSLRFISIDAHQRVEVGSARGLNCVEATKITPNAIELDFCSILPAVTRHPSRQFAMSSLSARAEVIFLPDAGIKRKSIDELLNALIHAEPLASQMEAVKASVESLLIVWPSRDECRNLQLVRAAGLQPFKPSLWCARVANLGKSDIASNDHIDAHADQPAAATSPPVSRSTRTATSSEGRILPASSLVRLLGSYSQRRANSARETPLLSSHFERVR